MGWILSLGGGKPSCLVSVKIGPPLMLYGGQGGTGMAQQDMELITG